MIRLLLGLSLVCSVAHAAPGSQGGVALINAPAPQPAEAAKPSRAAEKPGVKSWMQYRGDARNTGISYSPRPDYANLKVKWKYWTGANQSSTAAVHNGKLFQCTDAGHIHCISTETGKKLWVTFAADVLEKKTGIVLSSPLLFDGRLYIGLRDGNVACLDQETGEILWKYKSDLLGAEIYSSPKGGKKGIVVSIAGKSRGEIVGLNPQTGKELWSYPMSRETGSTPALFGGKVYVAAKDRRLHVVEHATGKPVSQLPLEGTTHCTPTIGMGIAFLITNGRHNLGIDLFKGTTLWDLEATGDDRTSIGFGNGHAYFPLGRYIYAVDAVSGKKSWEFACEHKVAQPLVNGTEILITSRAGFFRVISAEGKEVFSRNMGETFTMGPILVDGTIYLTAGGREGHHVYALE